MKKTSMWKKMGLLAGITYGLLVILQMFVWRGVFNNIQIAFTSLPVGWTIEFLLILAMAFLCIHYLKKDSPVTAGEVKGLIGGTALIVIFVLFTYQAQIEIVAFSISTIFPTLAENKLVQLTIILVRMLLLILGAFFAMNSIETPLEEEEELLDPETVVDELEEIAEEVMNEMEETEKEDSSEK